MSEDVDEVSEEPTPTWLGYSDPTKLTEDGQQTATRFADAARRGDWSTIFAMIEKNADLVNLARPGGRSGFAPLHQAAWQGDADAAAQLIRRGAWLALRNTKGERPCDVASRQGHSTLARNLAPPSTWESDPQALRAIELFLHALIRVRADELIEQSGLRLPPLEPLTGMGDPHMWFPIPGMYGGFSLRLLRGGYEPELQADSWCRVVSGSEERHLITRRGVQFVEHTWNEE